MHGTISHSLTRSLIIGAAAGMVAACAGERPLAPSPDASAVVLDQGRAEALTTIATLRQATVRYRDLNAAIADGFVFLHGCENRPGEGPVGTVYVHPGRMMDGVIDAALPDALIYEPPSGSEQRPTLVGVELVIPYPLWTETEPPSFLGATFQPEDEFGVFGLHVWIWKQNPEGLFAESNPRVSC